MVESIRKLQGRATQLHEINNASDQYGCEDFGVKKQNKRKAKLTIAMQNSRLERAVPLQNNNRPSASRFRFCFFFFPLAGPTADPCLPKPARLQLVPLVCPALVRRHPAVAT